LTTLTPTAVDTVPVVLLELAARSFADTLTETDRTPISTPSPKDAYAGLDQTQVGAMTTALAEFDPRTIPGDPRGAVSITVVQPTGTNGRMPAVVYVHSGDWIIGNFGTHEPLMPAERAGTSTAIFFVNYTASPALPALPLEAAIAETLIDEPTAAAPTVGPADRLSPREREVLALVAQGQTNKEIAEALFVAPSTIKTHVASLLTKLDASSRAHLATIAARRGLLPV
jgi:DNA-binding CsgD family transcriptional regulator